MATKNGSRGRCIASKKRPYRQRYAKSTQALQVALTGVLLLSKEDQMSFSLPLLSAIDTIKKGAACTDDWAPVFDVINMLEELMKSPKLASGDVGGYIEIKQQVVSRIMARHRDTGSRALYLDERASLDDLAQVWQEMLAQVTNSELFRASKIVADRVRNYVRMGHTEVGIVEMRHGT